MIRAVASGGTRGAAAPLGPVEIDTSSLRMDLFSLDSFILIIVTWRRSAVVEHGGHVLFCSRYSTFVCCLVTFLAVKLPWIQ